MSDIVERLRSAIRHRNLYKEHILSVAADEIERLREDWRVISQEKAVLLKRIEELGKERDALREIAYTTADAADKDVERLQRRIEELGKERDFYLDKACNGEPEATGTWIRYDRIDAAWETGNINYDSDVTPREIVDDALAELGIKRCEAERGDGHFITDEQIDAAWERAEEWAYVQPDCLETLAELGIVRCPAVPNGCGGTGLSLGDTCPDCDGHGWVKI